MADIADLTLKELITDRPDLVEDILVGKHEGSVSSSVEKDADENIVQWTEEWLDIDDVLKSRRVDVYTYLDNCIAAIAMHWYDENEALIDKKIVRDCNDSEYYVANDGNDSWDGHIGQPWKTIAKVHSTALKPGDSVFFKRGDVWREQFSAPTPGESNNVITFGAYGAGDKPIINGADDLLSSAYTWHLSCLGIGNYYITPAPPVEVQIVYADDTFLLLDTDEADSIIAEDHYFRQADNDSLGYNTLYIKDLSGIPGGAGFASIEGGQRNRCIYLYNDDFLAFNDIDTRLSNQIGINVSGTSAHIELQDCTVFGIDDQGIQLDSNTQNCIVNNCDVSYTCPQKQGAAKSGIVIRGYLHTIKNCDVHSNGLPNYDNIDNPEGILFDVRGISVCASNSEIINNRTWDNTGACIEGYNAENCFVTKNINLTSDGPEWKHGSNNNLIAYNIWIQAPHSKTPDIITGGSGSYGDWGGVPSDNIKLYNNIFFDVPVIGLAGGSKIILKNNIFVSKRWYQIASDQIEGLEMDNNYFVSGCLDYPKIVLIFGEPAHTLSEWQAVSGQDLNSLTGDSVFISEDDFHLLANSVCINAGFDVGLTEDFGGNAIVGLPDIGAYEHQGGL